MSEEALAAFHAAAAESVPIEQLQAVACRAIAAVTGAEAGLVTAGANAALTLGTAAILTGLDLSRMERLPNCEGFPNQIVVAREHRNSYDHAVRAAGAELVEVGYHEIIAGSGVRRAEAWEYEAAFGPRTAGVFYVLSPGSQPALEEVVRRAHAHHLPVLVDAAGELPPRENLKAIIAAGADLVSFSGGKAIRGPQATGILCGKRSLVGAAALQMLDMDDHWQLWEPPSVWFDRDALPGMPRHGIGRGYKVSKEQIVALLVALKKFARGDYDGEIPEQRRRLNEMAAALESAPVQCRIEHSVPESLPVLHVTIDERRLGRTAYDVCRALRAGTPPCYVGHAALAEGKLLIHPLHLNDQRAAELTRRFVEELKPR